MKNEKGFTLIELVVSIAVLSIIIVPFFGIFTNAAKLDMRSKKDLTANYLAQQLASEAKENPMVHTGWVETTNSSSTVFTKSSLDGEYSRYSAVLTYDDFTHSVESNGYENFSSGNDDYTADFLFMWNEDDDKKLGFSFSTDITGDEDGGIEITDPSSNVEVHLENYTVDEDINTFRLYFKISNDQPLAEYIFELDSDVDSINMKLSLDPDSTIDSPSKIKLFNETTDKPSKFKRELTLGLYTSNLAIKNHYDDDYNDEQKVSLEFTGTVILNNLDEFNAIISENSLKLLTVEISGYDPITGTVKVLKKLVTTVRTGS